MKKQMSLFVWAVAAFGMAPVLAAPVDGNTSYERYETRSVQRSYNNYNNGNYSSGRSQMYRDYDNGNRMTQQRTVQTYSNNTGYRPYASQSYNNNRYNRSYNTRQYDDGYYDRSYNTRSYGNTVRSTTRSETVRTQLKRKYYLAHPFFQPMEGKFGSITDLSYNYASYDLHVSPAIDYFSDVDATWSMKQFAIKEDFSYGLTDRIAIVAMARYDMSDYKFDWSTEGLDDKMSDSGLNIYGLGVQGRFVDTDEWIATLSAYYERQKDVANEFVLDLRAGYKIAKSTIYGVGRAWLVDFDESAYGNGIVGEMEDGTKGGFFIAYDTNVDTKMFFEGGIGVFSVLNEDWTLNLEAILGNYDWHNQGAVRAAVGWQPGDWFAIDLYARMSFYDTAEGQSLPSYGTYWDRDNNNTLTEGYVGRSKLDNYSEYTIGGQVIFYF